MKMMKISTIAVAVAVAIVGIATPARADIPLTVGDSYFLGFVQGVTPELANESDEAAMINTLITVPKLTAQTKTPPASGTLYDRTASNLNGPFSSVSATGVNHVTTGNSGINVTGSAYIIGKYDGPNVGDFVWLVPTGVYSVPGGNLTNPNNSSKKGGLSHYAVFPASTVPDGGVTLMLLGGALVGLETLRRKTRG